MNAAIRAVVRMGLYAGARVFTVWEVCEFRGPVIQALSMSLSTSPGPASSQIGVYSSSSWYPRAPYFCLSVTRQFYYYYFFNQKLDTVGFTSSKHSNPFKFSLHLSSLTVFILKIQFYDDVKHDPAFFQF